MKKILVLLLLLLIPINVFAVELDITSGNAVLYNLNDDNILYEKEKDSEVSIASLTKIMTCIVALENINNLDDKIVLTNEDFKGLVEKNASVAGFRIGEEVTYRDLLYGLMLPSGADAAQAITRLVAGSNDAFIDKMNNKAKELKLEHTNYVNPTGLDEDNHYSSVNDVATLFKYAIKNEKFKKIITTPRYTTSNSRLTFRSTISKALTNYNLQMDYVLGGKTGTTGNAGLCLATIAEKDNVNYLLVTVRAPYPSNTPTNYYDQKTIYEYFMNNYGYKEIVTKKDILVELPTKYAKEDKVVIKAQESISKYLENTFDKEKIIYKYKGIKEIKYNTKKNTKLGKVEVLYEDKLLDTIEIKLPKELHFDIFKYLYAHKYIVIGCIIILLLIVFIFIKKKKKKKKKR